MRFPSKLFHYKETVIYDCNIIMEHLEDEMTILDLLYAIKKINYNYTTRRISNAKGNNL